MGLRGHRGISRVKQWAENFDQDLAGTSRDVEGKYREQAKTQRARKVKNQELTKIQ